MHREGWKKYLWNLGVPSRLFDNALLDSLGHLVKKKLHHEAHKYRQFILQLDRYAEIYEMLGAFDRHERDELNVALGKLKQPFVEMEPKVLTHDDFHSYIWKCKTIFEEAAKKVKPIAIDEVEYIRLDEGIDCFFEGNFHAAIAMVASAVERRLFLLMSNIRPDKKEELEKLTFGQLIAEYLNKKDEYKQVVPSKHEQLLNHINRLRVLSVHPKGERITQVNARTLIEEALQFLIDTYNLVEKRIPAEE